ncbi:serine protease hepsin isoform X1, partial [Tachysurus ichikawai]
MTEKKIGAPGMALCSRWRAAVAVCVTAVVLAGLGAAIWAL